MKEKILVVDDNAGMRELLKTVLERWGYEALAAGDGAEALEILEREHCRTVISDVNMPRMDGITLLDRIMQRHLECAVIMLTAEDLATVTPLLIQKGAYCVIGKTGFYYELHSVLKNRPPRNNIIREAAAEYSISFELSPRGTS